MNTTRSARNRPASGAPRGEAAVRKATGLQTLDPALAVLPVLFATRLWLWWKQPYASEDAYITFRYAGELISGHGLNYNPGERVMGFTSLPWTLLCSLGMLLRIDPVAWSRGLSLAGDVLALWLASRMLREGLGRAPAWSFAIFFAAWPLFAAGAMSGLESSFFFTSILLAALLTARKHVLAGPSLALVALLRPEGVAAAALLAYGASWRDRLAALGMVGSTWIGLALYYGSPIPQSVLAKSNLYGTPGPWAARLWWDWLMPFPLGRYPAAADGVQLISISAVFAASVAAGLVMLFPMHRLPIARAAAAGLLVWLGYAALGVAYFWWYMIVPVAAFGLVAAAGLPRISRGAWLPVAAGSLMIGTWSLAPQLYLGRAETESRLFAPIAEYLVTHARAGESVFLEPIGMIGFRAPLRVIDEVGLVSPKVAKRRLEGPGWYTDIVESERPTWLVVRREVLSTGEAFAGVGDLFRNSAERDRMLAAYQEVPRSGPGAKDSQFTIYLRRAAP